MVYLFLSFIFCGVAISLFEHGRTLVAICLLIASCFMPVLEDSLAPPPAPAPVIVKPDPAVAERFKLIMNSVDKIDAQVKRCVDLSTALLEPAQ